MPETMENQAAQTQETEQVQQENIEQQQQKESDNTAQGGQPEAVSYVTRQELESMLQSLVSDIKSSLAQTQYAQSPAPQVQPAPAAKDDFPSYEEFIETIQDPRKTYTLFQKIREMQKQAIGRVTEFERRQEEARLADQYYSWMVNQIESATEPYEVFKNPKALDLYKARVVAEIQLNRGNMSKVNFPAMAKEIAELMSGAAAKTNIQSQKQVGGPISGTPSRAVPQSAEIRTISDLEAAIDNIFAK